MLIKYSRLCENRPPMPTRMGRTQQRISRGQVYRAQRELKIIYPALIEEREQVRKGRQQDQLPPIVRSPALEAVERQSSGSRQSERNAQQSTARRRNIGPSRVSFAVEDTLVRPVIPRKSLKPLANRVQQRT